MNHSSCPNCDRLLAERNASRQALAAADHRIEQLLAERQSDVDGEKRPTRVPAVLADAIERREDEVLDQAIDRDPGPEWDQPDPNIDYGRQLAIEDVAS